MKNKGLIYIYDNMNNNNLKILKKWVDVWIKTQNIPTHKIRLYHQIIIQQENNLIIVHQMEK
jgi:hypothetical protein